MISDYRPLRHWRRHYQNYYYCHFIIIITPFSLRDIVLLLLLLVINTHYFDNIIISPFILLSIIFFKILRSYQYFRHILLNTPLTLLNYDYIIIFIIYIIMTLQITLSFDISSIDIININNIDYIFHFIITISIFHIDYHYYLIYHFRHCHYFLRNNNYTIYIR